MSTSFEKLIHARLVQYLSQNSILSPYQFGFQKNCSTIDAIIHFTENIYNSLNSIETILNILTDYSKAFDTVNNEHRCSFEEAIQVRYSRPFI